MMMTQVRVCSLQKLGGQICLSGINKPVTKSREKGQQRGNDTLLAGLPVFALRLMLGVGSPLLSAATVASFFSFSLLSSLYSSSAATHPLHVLAVSRGGCSRRGKSTMLSKFNGEQIAITET